MILNKTNISSYKSISSYNNSINSKLINHNNINQNINKKSFISKIKIIKNQPKMENNKLFYIKNIIRLKNFNNTGFDKNCTKKSIGINTSEPSEKEIFLSEKKNYKSNNKNVNTSSSEDYKRFYIGFNKKGEFMDNIKIRELRRNLKSFSAFRNIFYKKNSKRNDAKNKNSLLTYNFNKDAYSNEERLLISISNNSLLKEKKGAKNKIILNQLKKQKTAMNNYLSKDYRNIRLKSLGNKNKTYDKYFQKLGGRKISLFLDDSKLKSDNRISNKNINNYTNNIVNSKNKNIKKEKNDIDTEKMRRKKELIEIMEEPNSLFNYVYLKIKDLKEHKLILLNNRKKGLRLKLEKMKNDLKQIEQKALYQVINLRYERVPGNEINIKTNLFCSK